MPNETLKVKSNHHRREGLGYTMPVASKGHADGCRRCPKRDQHTTTDSEQRVPEVTSRHNKVHLDSLRA